MRSRDLGPSLSTAITLGLALLIAGMFGLGMAIQRGVVEPPPVDWQLGRVHIASYPIATHAHYPLNLLTLRALF